MSNKNADSGLADRSTEANLELIAKALGRDSYWLSPNAGTVTSRMLAPATPK